MRSLKVEPYAVDHDQLGAGLRDYRPSVDADDPWPMRWMLLSALMLLCFVLGFSVGRHL